MITKIKSYEEHVKDLEARKIRLTTPRPCCKCQNTGIYTLCSTKSGTPYDNSRAYCETCAASEIHERALSMYYRSFTTNKEMFDSAVDDLEMKGLNFYAQNTADVLNKVYEEIFSKKNCFASRPEVKTAIVLSLYDIEYFYGTPYVINGVTYPCDFRIPSQKIILEIDGAFHGWTDNGTQYIRDINILAREEEGWEVVRIPTQYVDSKPFQLVNLMLATRNFLKKLRTENQHGLLPPRYVDKVTKFQEEFFEPKNYMSDYLRTSYR